MKLNSVISIAISAVMLGGCAGSPARISMASPEDLRAERGDNLCTAYAFGTGRDKARSELERRNALTPREWESVEKRAVFIGMSRTAALCSWGKPDRLNRTLTAAGTSEQWVYTCGSYGRGCKYLYIRDGAVSGAQD